MQIISNSEIDKFLYKIEKDNKKEDNETRPNPYYRSDFAICFLKLCKHFVQT